MDTKMTEDITFSDILIEPQYSEIESRSKISLETDMGKFKLALPIISANMKYVTGPKMAAEMYINGGLGILHRFNSIEDNVSDVQETYKLISDSSVLYSNRSKGYYFGVSIGVNEGDKERFDKLYETGVRIFCIDIAHGHCKLMKEMTKWVKSRTNDLSLICGNIATKEAALDLQEWGSDINKVGIGPGSACFTRRNTGVGVAQISALLKIADVSNIPIIADGGMSTSGDIAKALIFSDSVMLGSYLAGTTETPGSVYTDDNDKLYKTFGGSASGEAKSANGKPVEFVEGITTRVPFKGHAKQILRKIKEGVQSAFSYSGANNMVEYHNKVKYNRISSGGKSESKI